MSSRATKSPDVLGSNVIQQLTARTDSRFDPTDATKLKVEEIHASTTIIERIANARRGYLAWLAQQTAAITGKEPAIDRKADESWRAR